MTGSSVKDNIVILSAQAKDLDRNAASRFFAGLRMTKERFFAGLRMTRSGGRGMPPLRKRTTLSS